MNASNPPAEAPTPTTVGQPFSVPSRAGGVVAIAETRERGRLLTDFFGTYHPLSSRWSRTVKHVQRHSVAARLAGRLNRLHQPALAVPSTSLRIMPISMN